MALYIAGELLRALHYIHDFRGLNLVHRDVSPSNVMLSYTGGVKLIDFGVAKWENRSARTSAGLQWGKMGYKAPEMHVGDTVDRRSDIFGLSVILWELLAGRPLFPPGETRALHAEAGPPSAINPASRRRWTPL